MISEEELLEEIRQLANDEPPTAAEMTEFGSYSKTTYVNRFGSWSTAVKKAGFDHRELGQPISQKKLLKEIRRLASDKEPPTAAEMSENGQFSPKTFANQFGSWNNAVKEAGFKPHSNYTRDELIEEIDNLSDGDLPPTSTMMELEGGPSASTFIRHFGTWDNAIEVAGYDPNARKITVDKLLTEIHRLADGGNPPSESEMTRNGKYSVGSYRRRFGSWTKAKRVAGFQPPQAPKSDDLLEEINRLAENDRAPTQIQMRHHGKFSITHYIDQWDSWNNAVRQAGFSPNRVHNISKDSLINNLQKLEEKFGRPPKVHEVNRYGKFSERPYLDTFGNWWTALIMADLRPQRMYPLSPEAFAQLHEFAVKDRSAHPRQSLIALLFQFTGLNPAMVNEFSESWIKKIADDVIVTVPKEYTSSDEPWEFRVPGTWHNPVSDEKENTMLPGFIKWYFDTFDEFDLERTSVYKIIYRATRNAGLLDHREPLHNKDIGTVPHIRPVDIRMTFGVHMARNNAPKQYIESRLGLNKIPTYITVDKILIWLDKKKM